MAIHRISDEAEAALHRIIDAGVRPRARSGPGRPADIGGVISRLLIEFAEGLSAEEYVRRFPAEVQPYVNRIYQDGFADGAAQTAEAAFRAGHSTGRTGGSSITEDDDWAAYVKEQG